MEGGERCTFSSWKYSHYLEFVSAKDERIKVCCILCAGDKIATIKLQKHDVKFEESFGVAAQLSLQSKSQHVVLSRELLAKPQLVQEVLHHLQNK